MSSSSSPETPRDAQLADDLALQLCGFSLAELRNAMPPVATTSAELVKPEFLDQFAIDRMMSATESAPITPFSNSSSGPR